MNLKKAFNHYCVIIGVIVSFGLYSVAGIELAREAPFCINPNDPALSRDPDYHQWTPFLRLEKINTNHLRTEDKSIGLNKLDWIAFSKVKLNAKTYITQNKLQFIDETKLLAGSTELGQWIHIMIKAKVPLEGLYVQAIHGPLGIPFGQFNGFEFYTVEPINKTTLILNRAKCTSCNHLVDGFIPFPCSARSKASLQHPNVYLFHHKKHTQTSGVANTAKPTEFHIDFSFIDVICARVVSMQFLIIAVESFDAGDIEIVKTDILTNTQEKDFDGIPYPFHPDMAEHLDCPDALGSKVDDSFKILNETISPSTRNLRVNLEYDDCIVLKNDFKEKECPPGPFKCKGNIPALVEQRNCERLNEDPPCSCPNDDDNASTTPETPISDEPGYSGIPPDPDLQTGESTPNPLDAKEKEDERIRNETERSIRLLQFGGIDPDPENGQIGRPGIAGLVNGYHGKSMFFAWSISLSIATFSSRFFKEVRPGASCGGRGLWLWCHIFFSLISFITIWCGIIFIALAKLSGGDPTAHVIIGVAALILFHFNFFGGWFTAIDTKCRCIYTIIHMVSGYLSKVLAIVAIMVSSLTPLTWTPVVIMMITIEAINLVFYGIATLLMCAADKKMKSIPPHKVCPVPEQREEVEKTFLSSTCLGILLPIHIFIHIILFLLVAWLYWHPPIIRSYEHILNPPWLNINTNTTI